MTKLSKNFYDEEEKYPLFIKIPVYIFTAIIMLIIIFSLFDSTVISGNSMNPTLQDGDRYLLDKFSTIFELKTGDVVSCYYPGDNSTVYAKRIIGVPGDTIEIKDGRVLLNNKDITEKYWSTFIIEEDFPKTEVPDNSYFVIGDNINISLDSRSVGCISKSDIIGIMIAKI